MANRKILYFISGIALLVGIVCFFMSFYMYTNISDTVNNINEKSQTEAYAQNDNNIEAENDNKQVEDETKVSEDNGISDTLEMVMADNTINESTKMVYQYYYKNEGTMEESEEVPPYFLLGFNFNDMLEYYPDWQIVSFSGDEVVMRKIVDEKKENSFLITQKDGYIAVYYEDENKGEILYQMTETPISVLTQEEQVRLNDGIIVKGEYELTKILAEYTS